MAIALAVDIVKNGVPPYIAERSREIIYALVAILLLTIVKLYASGRTNISERRLDGKVVILTGGTSGIGAQTALQLARRGAQLVLLTQTPANDLFLVEYIDDLRAQSNNNMIYAEQVDLSDFHSIRKFATKWIDNAPPRRLDMVVLCAATLTPPGGKRRESDEGVEETWMVNYLANFHLLGILSPALRAQPVDRDVRIIITTCSSYIGSPSLKEAVTEDNWTPGVAYARSKLALSVFGQAFQKHLDAYERPDKFPVNARVIFVDPGFARTPSSRRWLTRGSLLGLLLYLAGYFVPWLLLKSPYMAAQSILYAAMEPELGRDKGGKLIKECMEMDFARSEILDEAVAKKLWEETDGLIEKVEKAQAQRRGAKRAQEDVEAQRKKDDLTKDEIKNLVDTIKKGKAGEGKASEKQTGKGKKKKSKAA